MLLTSAGMMSFGLFIPFIEAEFGWPRAVVTLPYLVAMIAWGASSLTFGKLADDHGARPVILGGVVLMASGFLGMALAQNAWQLCLAFGVLVGAAMGAAGINMGALLVSKHFAPSRRARAVSIAQTASPLNPLLFAPPLFLLLRVSDWRTTALVISAILWLVALPLAWVGARDPDSARLAAHQRIPFSACLPHLRNPSMLALFASRLACGLAIFQTPHMVAMAMSKGLDMAAGTMALSIYGAVAVGWTLLFGWLADRHGRTRMLGLSYALRGTGTIALALAAPNELGFFLLVAVAVGPTFGTIAVQNVLFYEAAGAKLAGVILGLSFIVHQVGSAIGPQVGSIVFDQTHTYDGFSIVIGLFLLASAAMTFNLKESDLQPSKSTATAVLKPA
ncbi:MAG: MFS transporter [Chloroflexi bacterium]|nr:MFS transporter [Chloroflexota bacterium]